LHALDEIDRQLIAALQINARESVAMLARQLGIARTTVTSRLARLEKTQVITGYGVRLGQRVVDGGLQAYVGITVQARSGKDVLRRLSAMAQVQQLCAVSGEFDAHMNQILAILKTATATDAIYVHCKHGQDRTGLVLGLERVIDEKWAPKAAHDEMLKIGFHPFFLGLNHYFEERTGWEG